MINECTEEQYVERLYEHLRNGRSLRSFYLPHSDVYYVRLAIHSRFGVWLSHAECQKMMEEETDWCKHKRRVVDS